MIITIGGQKGGTGKTTIATELVVHLSLKGHNVLLIDADDFEGTGFESGDVNESGLSRVDAADTGGGISTGADYNDAESSLDLGLDFSTSIQDDEFDLDF